MCIIKINQSVTHSSNESIAFSRFIGTKINGLCQNHMYPNLVKGISCQKPELPVPSCLAPPENDFANLKDQLSSDTCALHWRTGTAGPCTEPGVLFQLQRSCALIELSPAESNFATHNWISCTSSVGKSAVD